MRDYSKIAKRYALDVVAGKIAACRQVKMACARFINDLKSSVWRYDKERAHHACQFVELCVHTKGKWAGQTITLEAWQIFMTVNIFGLVDQDGLRKYREAFLLIPRKNAKSTWAAAIGLYMGFADGEAGAEIYVGANSEKQANEVLTPARRMAQLSPGFIDAFGVEVTAKTVLNEATGSFMAGVIAKPGDGSSPHCAILDEAHENKTSEQYDTMKTGTGAREQPLVLTITTAGFDTAGPCRILQNHAEAVLEGMIEDDSLFVLIYTIDKDDDWTDFETWKKANPNYGVSIFEKGLKLAYETALKRPEKAGALRTKHLNEWMTAREAWLNLAEWQKGGDTSLSMADLKGCAATIGIDLSTKIDITAVVVRVTTPAGKIALFPFLFVPQGAIEANTNSDAYAQWSEAGEVITCDGAAIEYDVIEEKVRELCEHFKMKAIGFDNHQANMMAQRLQKDGHNVVECHQNSFTFGPAMKEFEANLANGLITHPANRCFDWMASNVKSKPDAKNNGYPRKDAPHQKIDGIVAALMAEAVALEDHEPEDYAPLFSVWRAG